MPTAGNGAVWTVDSGIDTSTAYRFHQINIAGNTVNAATVAQVQFFENASPAGIATVSTAAAATTAPASATLAAIWTDVSGSASLNADLVFRISRDDGVTWTAAAMADLGPGPVAGARVLMGSADLAAQPSGTALRWRLETANGKEQQVHGVWMQWR